jgi:hypothetical protein
MAPEKPAEPEWEQRHQLLTANQADGASKVPVAVGPGFFELRAHITFICKGIRPYLQLWTYG